MSGHGPARGGGASRSVAGRLAAAARRLFASPGQAALTLVAGVAILALAVPALRFLLLDATWAGAGPEACRDDGACWVFVRVHLGQFLFGLYPEDQRWRIVLAGLLGAGLALGAARAGRRARGTWVLGLVLGYPAVAAWLAYGGLGLAVVETPRWGGLFLTLALSAVGIAASLPIGIVLALGRRSRLPVPRALSTAFIELWRGVPLITVLFMASVMLPLFLPLGLDLDKLLRALIGITLFAGAYMAEVVRGGLEGVPPGQEEAARALGLSYPRRMALVVLPQALKHMIPGITNTFIALFKDTSLVLIIGMYDLLGIVQAAATDPAWLGHMLEGYLFAGAVYWLFCAGMSRLSRRLELRLGVGAAA